MLESLLADVLTRVLGQYLRGIDRDNVNFGVWGGCLELRGLALRPEALAVLFETLGLELPVTVDAGFIGMLRIVVPWQTLGSTPVRVYMERLTIVARPVRGDASDTSELKLREQRLARAKLATDDAVREAAWSVMYGKESESMAGTAKASPGWAAKLITKIIENLQVELADIIIRFEDVVSDPRRPYVVALHCDTIKAVSADERWREAYIDTPEHGSVTRKLVSVSGFEIKWGPLGTPAQGPTDVGRDPVADAERASGDVPVASSNPALPTPDHFESHMTLRAFVEQGAARQDDHAVDATVGEQGSSAGGRVDSAAAVQPSTRMRSIVPPFDGFMRVSLAKRNAVAAASVSSSTDNLASAVELDVQFPEVTLELDDVQYASILQTSVYFARLTTRGFRPATPRDWWMWCMEQILPGFKRRHAEALCLTPDGLRKRTKERHIYVATRTTMLKARRTGIAPPPNMYVELEKMEATLSFEDVMLYRDIVDNHVASIGKTWRRPGEQAAESGTSVSSFWSMLGYSNTATTAGDKESEPGAREAHKDDSPGKSEIAMQTTTVPSTESTKARDRNVDAHTLGLSASSRSISIPFFRAGILLRKIGVRMHSGGFPKASVPIVELVLEDLRVGITTTSNSGMLLEAVLGTLEARDLQAGIPIVYPRVPWSPRNLAPAGESGAETETSSAIHGESLRVDDQLPVYSVDDDGGDLPEIEHAAGFALQIQNSSYPTRVEAALVAIRGSAGESTILGSQVSVQKGGNEDSGSEGGLMLGHKRNVFFNDSSLLGTSLSSTGHDPLRSRRAFQTSTPHTSGEWDNADTEAPTTSSSMRISHREFLGSPDGDASVDSLDYLIALRIRNEPSSDSKATDVTESGVSRLAIDVAVGRLEAIVDGPRGAFLWGLQFWQPKGKPDDPIMAFLGAAAGARVAELRMELENALLSRKVPMRIDAVICAPRFILPGRGSNSPVLVANMGTFGLRSPVPVSEWRPMASRPSSSERYTSYMLSLDDLGIYLAPNCGAAVTRRFQSFEDTSDSQVLDGVKLNQFGLDSGTVSTEGVERIIRPFSLRLFLDVLQDAQVVQVAQHGRTAASIKGGGVDNKPAHVAKVRLRGDMPGILLVLSQGACQRLLVMSKRWGSALTGSDKRRDPVSSGTNSSSDMVESDFAPPLGQSGLQPTSDVVPDGNDNFFYTSLAAVDAKLHVDTVSLELRDRAGERIITFVASGTRMKLIKTGSAELSSDFRLQSWTVTDGSRGTTAAFRCLAHAGQAPQSHGVSPPHTYTRSNSNEGESSDGGADQESFLRVQYRQNVASGEKFISLRFLSLNMVCVRETYVRIAAFFYGVLREYKASRGLQESSALLGPSSGLETAAGSFSIDQMAGVASSTKSRTGGGVPISQRRIMVSAILDGFSFQLASAEGALAVVEMTNCSLNVELMADGGLMAHGDVGYICTQDLTAPIEAHKRTVYYKRNQSARAMKEWTESASETGNVGQNPGVDGWSLSIPPSGHGHTLLQAKFCGMNVTYLHRFIGLLTRYFSLLRDGLKPAIDEVRSAVEASHGLPSVESLGTSLTTSSNILYEIVAEEFSLRLPRYSSCAEESVALELRSVRISNEAVPLEGYKTSFRFAMAGIIGSVMYMAPGDNQVNVMERGSFLTVAHADLRLDMLPSDVSSSGKADETTSNCSLSHGRLAPSIRGRFVACDNIELKMCEAQYTVLYFVLTENFAESVTFEGTDFARRDIPNVSRLAGCNVDQVEEERDRSAVDALTIDSPNVALVRLLFEVPCTTLTLARGWDVRKRACHVLQVRLTDFGGTVDVTTAARIVLELSSNIVSVEDIRQEARPESSILVLPLAEERKRNTESTLDTTHRVNNISLSYEKPFGERANIALVLSHIQLSIIPELLRDLSFLAIPGWPFLSSSPFAPDCEYLGRIFVLTLSRCQIWLGAEQYPGDTQALIASGDVTARINYLRKTAARTVSMQAKDLNLALTYARKSVVVEDDVTAKVRHVALTVSGNDALIVYPGDGSMEYVGPNADALGRRLEIATEFVLCRVNVKEAPILVLILTRLNNLEESALSLRAWRQPNPSSTEHVFYSPGKRGALAIAQAQATRKTLTLLVTVPAARVLFTDESNGRFVPILELNARNVVIQANMPRVLQLVSDLSANLFNVEKGWWEPGLELWPVEVSFSAGESGSRALNLNSASKLDLNVTPSTVSGAYRVGNAIRSALMTANQGLGGSGDLEDQKYLETSSQGASARSRDAGSRQPSVAAFWVSNELGRPISMWLPRDSRRRLLRDGEDFEVDLPRDSLVPGAADSSSADDNASRERALRCTLMLEGYIPLELSAADVGAHVMNLCWDGNSDSSTSVTSVLGREAAAANEAPPETAVVWEVRMENGVPSCTIRSVLRLVNETRTCLEVRIEEPIDRQVAGGASGALFQTNEVGHVRILEPGKAYAVPMDLCSSEIKVRPIIEESFSAGYTNNQGLDEILYDLPDTSDEDDSGVFGDVESSSALGQSVDSHNLDVDLRARRDYDRAQQARREISKEDANLQQSAAKRLFEYEWSAPLPSTSWLTINARDNLVNSQTTKKASSRGALLKALTAGGSGQSNRTLALCTIACQSTQPNLPDFFVTVCPKALGSTSQSSRAVDVFHQGLDISLQAPIVLENKLPGLLSFQIVPRGHRTEAALRGHERGESSRVAASGVVKPAEKAYIHSTGYDAKHTWVALAFRNDVGGNYGARGGELLANQVGEVDPPTSFGAPATVFSAISGKRGIAVEPRASSSSESGQSRRDAKELFVRISPSDTDSTALCVWSQYWIRNRSDVSLEFCGRNSFYANGTAVRLLPPCPQGSMAHRFICFEGPYVSLRRGGGPDASDMVRPIEANLASGPRSSIVQDWWTYPSDLREIVKPVGVAIPGVSLVMEVRPGLGAFAGTMVVTVRNSAWIVNRTPMSLQWCQSSALDVQGNALLREVHTLAPYGSHSIHWDSKTENKSVNLRLAGNEQEGQNEWFWSPPVPISLGAEGEFPAKMYRPKTQEQYIARVISVKLRGGSSSLYVHPEDRENPPYRIVNMCRTRSVAFHQVGSEERPWLVRPGKSTRYSWDEPLASARRRELRIEVIEPLPPERAPIADDALGVSASQSDAGGSARSGAPFSRTSEFHHPKLALNIDIVKERALEKRETFSPPLIASVTVDGATKTVTFWDELESSVEEQDRTTTDGEVPVNVTSPTAQSSTRSPEHDVQVPTIVWDEIGSVGADPLATMSWRSSRNAGAPDSAVRILNRSDEVCVSRPGTDYPAIGASKSRSLAGGEVNRGSTDNLSIDVCVSLVAVGISIVDSSPLELAYVLASGVNARYEAFGLNAEIGFDVAEIQVDNQLPNAAYPVLMWAPLQPGFIRAASGDAEDAPSISSAMRVAESAKTLAFEARRSGSSNGIPMWKSIRAAVRPFDIALDEEFVLRVIVFATIVAKSSDEAQEERLYGADGEHIPLGAELGEEIDDANGDGVARIPEVKDRGFRSYAEGRGTRTGLSRIYVEELTIYPAKIFLSSTASRGSASLTSAGYRSASLRALVAVLLNVENCELDFAALELAHVFDSSAHFAMLVKEYYVAQLNGQRLKLLTSNTLIGNPAALFDTVSIGARDLFVEPGRAKGSAEFLASVGRGSRSLISHTVGGIVGSIGGIPRAVASGLETAVGDREYLAERERIRGIQLPAGRGPLSGNTAQGMMTGAMSFAHGITSGMSGIFKEPVAGARKGGAAGFLRGVGKGLVGGVVKPVTGVMDLIAEPAAGLSKLGDQRKRGGAVTPARPPRSFRSSGQRLVAFDLRTSTGEALSKLVQSTNSITIAEEVLEWVELGDRPGRKETDSADLIWAVMQHYYRVMPGARRDRAHNHDASSSSALRTSSLTDHPEKIQVALVMESRIVVASLDGRLVSDILLDPGRNLQLEDEGTELVLLAVFPVSKGPDSASMSSRISVDNRTNDVARTTENYVRIFERIQCGSEEARDDLHFAVDRALVMLRQTAKRPRRGSAVQRPESFPIELSSLPVGSSGRASDSAADRIGESFPVVTSPGRMPGRGPHDEHRETRSGSGGSKDEPLVTQGKTEELNVVASARRKASLGSAMRRLSMGGTKRAMEAKRSVRVIVGNALFPEQSLCLVRCHLDDGTWRSQPPDAIESGQAVMFEADSAGGQGESDASYRLNRDVRGIVLFEVRGGETVMETNQTRQVVISFANLSLASSSYSVKSSPGLHGSYEGGNGAHATVVFTIDTEANAALEDEQTLTRLASRASRESLASAVSLPIASRSSSSGVLSFGANALSSIGNAGAAGGRLFKQRTQGRPNASAGPSTSEVVRSAATETRIDTDSVALAQLIELGFNKESAKMALIEAEGDLVLAVDILTRT